MGESGSPNILLFSAIGFAIVVAALAVAFGPSIIQHSKQAKVLEKGVEATASIVELVDTGNRINYNPEVRIILDVKPDQGKPFRSETRMVLSSVDAVKYQPGKSVQVRYDPANPSVAAIVEPPSRAP